MFNSVLRVRVAVSHPACIVTLWPGCRGYHPPDTRVRSQECFLRVLLEEVEMKRGGKRAKQRQNVARPFCHGAREHEAGEGNFFFFKREQPETCQTWRDTIPTSCPRDVSVPLEQRQDEGRLRLVLSVELPLTCAAHRTSICCILPGVTVTAYGLGGGKLTCMTGWGLAKESDWYRRGHFTQRGFQEVSHQDAKGKLRLFHSQPNRATRRGGPFRRQYPLTNAIWDDFLGPCVAASQP